MTIIDRYLVRQFLETFLICLVSLTGLYVVFDAFTHLDAFLRCAERQGSLLEVLGKYYGARAFWFFDWTLGLLTLASAMFTVAMLQRHHELTALMAAGISKVRVLKPLLGCVIGVILLGVANRELLLPRFQQELARSPRDLAGDARRQFVPRRDEQTDISIRGQAAYADKQRIEKPVFRLPSALEGYARQIVAKDAFYRPPSRELPGGYLVCGIEVPKDLHLQSSLVLHGKPVIITPRDAPDQLGQDQCFVVSQLDFEQLTNSRAWQSFSSTFQLIRGLHNRSLGFGGNVRVTIHTRLLQPLMDLNLLLLGVPLLLARGNRNVFAAMALCGLIVLGFTLVAVGFQYLGSIYAISPALAAWAPLMIFVPVAVELAYSLRR
jgi:lipopolysaccharide export system permease protein